MDVTISLGAYMPSVIGLAVNNKPHTFNSLLANLRNAYPKIQFTEGQQFSWNPSLQQVLYQKGSHNTAHAIFSILHELGHALLSHKEYTSDINLLQLEVAAWSEAHAVASRLKVTLDQDYIEDCLDSYRDWLHLRATCPTCYSRSLQASRNRYNCFNCQSSWSVSPSRLCRSYRLKTV